MPTPARPAAPRYTRIAPRLLAAGLLLSAGTALAKPATKPGEYLYTVKVKMMGMSMPGVDFKHCVTQADIDSGRAYVNTDKNASCSTADVKWSGDDFTLNSVCKNPDMTMTGKGTAKPDGMSMTMDVAMGGGMPMKQQQTVTAKRIGDCSK